MNNYFKILIFFSLVFNLNNVYGEDPIDPASAKISKAASFKLDKTSFTLGLAYVQVTYKTTNPNSTTKAQLTDNGAPSLILELTSKEKILKDWPLVVGNAFIGWDINAAASIFDTHYELIDSALRGVNRGTKVTGGYLGVAPTIFLKVGPLYANKNIFWKIGYGVGPGLIKSKGQASFATSSGRINYDVGKSSPVMAIYNSAVWQLVINDWSFNLIGKWLTSLDGTKTSVESYGFGAGYRFLF